MFDRKEVKAIGKENFKNNYWRSVLMAFILVLISAITSGSSGAGGGEGAQSYGGDPSAITTQGSEESAAILGALTITLAIIILVRIFILNPLQVGCYRFFRQNNSFAEAGKADINTIGVGFSGYGRTFITLLLRDLFLMLWTMLLIVPGLVKAYSYRMVPYILKDHPEMTPTEVITESRRIMNGNKWAAFVFDLSYIGWYILGAVTLGIVQIFWTAPYKENANAKLYLTISDYR